MRLRRGEAKDQENSGNKSRHVRVSRMRQSERSQHAFRHLPARQWRLVHATVAHEARQILRGPMGALAGQRLFLEGCSFQGPSPHTGLPLAAPAS